MGNKNEDGINSKDFLIGTLVGSMVGAAAALLLAPKSGKDLRSDLNNQTSSLREKGNEFASIALEKSSNLAKQVSDQSSQVAGKVKDFKGSIKIGGTSSQENPTVPTAVPDPASETTEENQETE